MLQFFQVKRLEKLVNERESGLGSATTQLTSLKDAAERLKLELNDTRNELRVTKSKASAKEVRYHI